MCRPVGLGKRDSADIGNVLQVDHVVRRDQVVAQTDDDIRCARHKDRLVVVLQFERGGFLQSLRSKIHKISQERFSSQINEVLKTPIRGKSPNMQLRF